MYVALNIIGNLPPPKKNKKQPNHFNIYLTGQEPSQAKHFVNKCLVYLINTTYIQQDEVTQEKLSIHNPQAGSTTKQAYI